MLSYADKLTPQCPADVISDFHYSTLVPRELIGIAYAEDYQDETPEAFQEAAFQLMTACRRLEETINERLAYERAVELVGGWARANELHRRTLEG